MKLPDRIAISVAIAVTVVAATTGCVPGPAATSSAPVATPVLSSVAQVRLPIAAYELTETQLAQVQYLTQRLRQRCMRDFGFDYLPGLSTASIAQTVRTAEEFDSRWYGISDDTAARTYGYHLPQWVTGTAAPQQIATLPVAARAVFDGSTTTADHRPVPAGGCVAAAAKQLAQAMISVDAQRSGGADSTTLVGTIRRQDFNRAQSDPRVLAVFGAWSTCMASYGHHYRDPFTALADPRWRTIGTTPGAPEIKTARDDITCKLRVNLLGVEYAVVSDYQNADIAKNGQALAAVRAQVTQEAEAIRQLMARNAA